MKQNILLLLTPKSNVAYLNEEMTLRQGLEKFKAHGYTAIPVLTKNGEYAGVVSEGDLLWAILDNKNIEETLIKDILRRNYPSCKISANIDFLTNYIINYNFVPIIDDRNIFMGIITRKSIINNLSQKKES